MGKRNVVFEELFFEILKIGGAVKQTYPARKIVIEKVNYEVL